MYLAIYDMIQYNTKYRKKKNDSWYNSRFDNYAYNYHVSFALMHDCFVVGRLLLIFHLVVLMNWIELGIVVGRLSISLGIWH